MLQTPLLLPAEDKIYLQPISSSEEAVIWTHQRLKIGDARRFRGRRPDASNSRQSISHQLPSCLNHLLQHSRRI